MEMMSPQIDQLASALAAAQAELEPAKKNAENPAFRSRYADLAACFEACRQILPKHGLAISQILIPQPDPNTVCVRSMLIHTSGQWLCSECVLSSGGASSRNAAQAAGSAITYARRYGLSALVGIVADDDDDGNGCGQPQPQQRQQQRPAPQPQRQAQPQQSMTVQAFLAFCRQKYRTAEEFSRDLGGYFQREIRTTSDLTEKEMHEFMEASHDHPATR